MHLQGGGVVTVVVIFLYVLIAGYALYSRRERPFEESLYGDVSGRGYFPTDKSTLPPDRPARARAAGPVRAGGRRARPGHSARPAPMAAPAPPTRTSR